MPIRWICPVCGAENPDSTVLTCIDCYARIPSEHIEVLKKVPEAPASSNNIKNNGTEHEDELIRLFKERFEEYKIKSPPSWKRRLSFLASNAEPSRRHATITFVDLCQYTYLSNVLSEDQTKEILGWFYEMVTRVVEFYGGFVISFIGDAVLSAFGAPCSFERDAESAVHSLLAIRKEVERKKVFHGHPLAIRAGADCGSVQVVINEVHGGKRVDLMGPSVNLASRLENAAKTMEILLSNRVAEQVRELFVLEEREPFIPKNFGRKVVPFAVLSPLSTPPFSHKKHRLKLISRDREMELLSQKLQEFQGGQPCAVCISGEVGCGKSRLLKEFTDTIKGKPFWKVFYECQPSNRHSLLEVIRHVLLLIARESEKNGSVFNILTSDLPPVFRASLGYVLQEPEYIKILQDVPGKILKQQITDTVIYLLRKLSQEKPIFICIDDLHWIDVFSWNILNSLAGEDTSRIFLLVSGRRFGYTQKRKEEGLQNIRPSLDNFTLSRDKWIEITLKKLSQDDLLKILEQIFTSQKLHPAALSNILQKSSGIPLYVVELGNQLKKYKKNDILTGLLINHKEEDLSNLVLEVLQNQLDELTITKRSILQVSSVLGRRFSYQILRQFEILHMDLLSELYALKGLELLEEQVLPGDIFFSFNPSLLRDAAYRMLTKQQKEELHTRAARKLEREHHETSADFLYEIAFHWLKAGNFSRARLYLKKAAEKALDLGMPAESLELINFGLEIINRSKRGLTGSNRMLALQQEALLRNLAGKAVHMLGDYQVSSKHFQQMYNLAESVGNKHWMTLACKGLALNAIEQGKTSQAFHFLEKGATLYGKSLPAHIKNVQGIAWLRNGDLEKAQNLFQTLIDTAEENNISFLSRADACNNLGLTCWQNGALIEAKNAFEKGLQYWRREKNMFGQAATLNNLGIIAEKQGKYSQALRFYNESAILSEQTGYVLGLTATYANIANLHLLTGNAVQAEKAALQSIYYAEIINHKYSESIARENLGLAYCARAKHELATKQLKKALSLASELKFSERIDSASISLAWLYMKQHKLSYAQERLAQTMREPLPELKQWKTLLQTALEVKKKKTTNLMKPFLKDLCKRTLKVQQKWTL